MSISERTKALEKRVAELEAQIQGRPQVSGEALYKLRPGRWNPVTIVGKIEYSYCGENYDARGTILLPAELIPMLDELQRQSDDIMSRLC